MRLDQAVAQKYSTSRNRAQFFIEHGLVSVGGVIAKKSSSEVGDLDIIVLNQEAPQAHYVSRSAEKLEKFMEFTGLSIANMECLDVGASTGGFTQVLLARDARSVVALDIGTAQLHSSLIGDERIISLENTDIRQYISQSPFDCIVGDISFISLRLLLPSMIAHLRAHGILIVLFKPQFELQRQELTRWGIPKSETLRLRVINDFREWLKSQGHTIRFEQESELAGEAGNREMLFCIEPKMNTAIL
jgi:23S rRNA (cytidine1920-2'-O)/16S rRNA (cytidine1409-2'-O)-methyltransferase